MCADILLPYLNTDMDLSRWIFCDDYGCYEKIMKQMQKAVLALAVLATISLPVMAESIDVRVIGTITPSACTPQISGGGTVDYGAIKPETLSADEYTVLAEKQLDFSITCDAPAKVAIKAINGRPDSLAGATEGATSGAGVVPVDLYGTSASIAGVGLGLDNGAKVGGYSIALTPSTVQVDNENVDSLRSNDDTASWKTASTTGGIFNSASQRYVSWAATGTTEPVAFETMSGKLNIRAYINKTSELDLTKPVALDGLTTIELVYL